MKIRNLISAVAACAVAATAFVIPASAADTHTASLTFQTSVYTFRNTFNQEEVLYWNNDLGEADTYAGATFTSAAITGDGTYTVELNGITDGGWNMLKLETDIDLNEHTDCVITITGVESNGAAVEFDAAAAAMVRDTSLSSDEYSAYDFNIANAARCQLINTYDGVGAIANTAYDNIKVTFEVTGLSAAGGSADAGAGTEAGKGSSDTGVEGIAVVAGAAIVAGGAMLLSKKRK